MTSTLRFIKNFIPLIFVTVLVSLLWYELFHVKSSDIPSPLIGETLPSFKVPDLLQPNVYLTDQELSGRVVLLNVWASWCHACVLEHPMLMKIARDHRIPIYSINYKDNSQTAKDVLAKQGNPFTKIGQDISGHLAIDLGIYGTPETFVLSRQGRIVYRHVGAITENSWQNILYPIIKHYGG